LERLEHAPFSFELNAVTCAYFERMATLENKQTADDIRAILKMPPDVGAVARLSSNARYNSTLRTTCVSTAVRAAP
jgi:hypothetical protein